MTVTFATQTKSAIQRSCSILNAIAKHYGQHVFADISMGYQSVRDDTEGTIKKYQHTHCTLAFEHPEYIDHNNIFSDLYCLMENKNTVRLDELAKEIRGEEEIRIHTVNGMLHFSKYTHSPKEVMYNLVMHKDGYQKHCGCPMKGKCRRKGCYFRMNMNDWQVGRYSWQEKQ